MPQPAAPGAYILIRTDIHAATEATPVPIRKVHKRAPRLSRHFSRDFTRWGIASLCSAFTSVLTSSRSSWTRSNPRSIERHSSVIRRSRRASASGCMGSGPLLGSSGTGSRSPTSDDHGVHHGGAGPVQLQGRTLVVANGYPLHRAVFGQGGGGPMVNQGRPGVPGIDLLALEPFTHPHVIGHPGLAVTPLDHVRDEPGGNRQRHPPHEREGAHPGGPGGLGLLG